MTPITKINKMENNKILFALVFLWIIEMINPMTRRTTINKKSNII